MRHSFFGCGLYTYVEKDPLFSQVMWAKKTWTWHPIRPSTPTPGSGPLEARVCLQKSVSCHQEFCVLSTKDMSCPRRCTNSVSCPQKMNVLPAKMYLLPRKCMSCPQKTCVLPTKYVSACETVRLAPKRCVLPAKLCVLPAKE